MKQTFNYLCTLLCAFMLMSTGLHAQTTVSGNVKDATTGDPLAGVNILIKGTVSGTITDVDGNFSLRIRTVPATLVFSMIGFTPQELEVTADKSNIEIKLEESIMSSETKILEEIRDLVELMKKIL